MRVERFDKFNRRKNLLLAEFVRFGNDNRVRLFDLIVVKLAEVFKIHFAFSAVDNRCDDVDFERFFNLFYRLDYIGKFTDARRLDYDSVRAELLDDFLHRF